VRTLGDNYIVECGRLSEVKVWHLYTSGAQLGREVRWPDRLACHYLYAIQDVWLEMLREGIPVGVAKARLCSVHA
jgi:hypothetical protein